MFEDSTFESTGSIRTRSRGWMLATLTFNGAVLLAFALFPLLHPEALPRMMTLDLMTAPPPRQEPPPPQRPVQEVVHKSDMVDRQFRAPSVIPPNVYMQVTPEPPLATSAATMPIGSPFGGDLRAFTQRSIGPSVRPEPQTKARVSQGVMDGLLIGRVIPEYPTIAREMRIEGTVILQASISKMGTIENLRVVSGPELLRRAAVSAVSQWRYRPYLLNGEPVEVETTVNVSFTLH